MPNVVKKITEGSLEALKEGAEQLTKVVAPEKVVEQLTGNVKGEKDEIGEYLTNLDPKLSKEEVRKIEETDRKKLEETRKKLRSVTPNHMKPPPQKEGELRPYEKILAEEEEKKAEEERMRKLQQSQALPVISSPIRGLARKKRPVSADFEAGKNVKVG